MRMALLAAAGAFLASACATAEPLAADGDLSTLNSPRSNNAPASTIAASADPMVGPYLSGRISARENAVGEAAASFDRVADANAADRRLVRQAFFYSLAAGEMSDALAQAARLRALIEAGPADDAAIDESPEDTDGLARLALAADAMNRDAYAEAQDALVFTSSEPFVAAMAHIMNAWAEVGLKGPDAGLEAMQANVESVFTGFHPAQVAFMAEKAGRLPLAMDAYRNSVFGLGGPVGRAAYGAFLERAGDPVATEGYYELIARQPGPDRRLATEALARIKAGRISVAYADVTPQQGSAIAFYSFAAFLLEQFAEQREQADAAGYNVGQPRYNLPLALAQIALHLDPDFAEARRLAGVIYNIYEDAPAAVAALERIAPSSPHYVQAQIEIAAGLSRQGRKREAISRLERTLRRNPDAEEVRFALANLAAADGDDAGAVRHLTKLIDAVGETPEADAWRYFVARADSLLKIDRWDDAEADLRRAVELAPAEPTALNYLGYTWAERGVNLDEAFALIEKAVEADSLSGAIIDSLGWAHYQVGDYNAAVEHLETAAALEPADPTITEHLGDVYWQLGREVEARFQWRRALELEPGERQVAALRGKLEVGLAPGAERTTGAPRRRGADAPVLTSSPVREPGDGAVDADEEEIPGDPDEEDSDQSDDGDLDDEGADSDL